MRATVSPPPQQKSPFLESVRQVIRRRHFSYSTEKQYLDYIKDFILFHKKRHPKDMGTADISAYINHLTVCRHVAASTQNTALCALLFLYRQVVQVGLPDIQTIEWAKKSEHVPEVFTPDEAKRVLAHLSGTTKLVASLLYGCGLALGSAISGSLLFGIGLLLRPLSNIVDVALLACLALCVFADLGLARVPCPQMLRQVPAIWRNEQSASSVSFGYGLQLGLGFVTRINTRATYGAALGLILLGIRVESVAEIFAALAYSAGRAVPLMVFHPKIKSLGDAIAIVDKIGAFGVIAKLVSGHILAFLFGALLLTSGMDIWHGLTK